MQRIYSVEELIIDDSFINYCNKAGEKDIFLWENYLLNNPGEKETIEEARAFVIGLTKMLQTGEREKALQEFKELLQTKRRTVFGDNEQDGQVMNMDTHPGKRKNTYWWIAAASVALFAILSVWILMGGQKSQTALANDLYKIANDKANVISSNLYVKTGPGEKREFFLSDSTKVTLNANTTFSVDSGFGRNGRLVILEGEAFFDVTHNAGSPFIVRLKDFDVKVLGTMFNVKSYPGEKSSEAALVKGKVEILLKNKPSKKIFLKPNQKFVLLTSQMGGVSTDKNARSNNATKNDAIKIKPLSISADGSSIIETGWLHNRLEINDETFIELKSKLERKYNVIISFSDEDVMKYRYTALFMDENIDQVLKAMQLSLPFKYTNENNRIIISK